MRIRAQGIARLLLAVLTLQLALPALGLTGAIAAGSGEDLAICSINGMQVVHLDGGQPADGARKGEPPCVFCLPLIGAAAPPADAVLPVPTFGPADAQPLPPSLRRESPRHFSARPRAPPLPA